MNSVRGGNFENGPTQSNSIDFNTFKQLNDIEESKIKSNFPAAIPAALSLSQPISTSPTITPTATSFSIQRNGSITEGIPLNTLRKNTLSNINKLINYDSIRIPTKICNWTETYSNYYLSKCTGDSDNNSLSLGITAPLTVVGDGHEFGSHSIIGSRSNCTSMNWSSSHLSTAITNYINDSSTNDSISSIIHNQTINATTAAPILVEQPPFTYEWIFLFVVIFIIAGGLGNILVCLAIALDRKLQNLTNYFLLSLAIADLLVSLFVMPLGAIPAFLGYWPLGVTWCNVYVTCDVLACSASIWHMCFISLGRYLGIKNPLGSRHRATKRIVGIKIAVAWLMAMPVSSSITILGTLNHSNIMPEPELCVINNRAFFIFGSLVAFYIPMVIMVSTYALTVQLLRKKALFAAAHPESEVFQSLMSHRLGGSRYSATLRSSDQSEYQSNTKRNKPHARQFHQLTNKSNSETDLGSRQPHYKIKHFHSNCCDLLPTTTRPFNSPATAAIANRCDNDTNNNSASIAGCTFLPSRSPSQSTLTTYTWKDKLLASNTRCNPGTTVSTTSTSAQTNNSGTNADSRNGKMNKANRIKRSRDEGAKSDSKDRRKSASSDKNVDHNNIKPATASRRHKIRNVKMNINNAASPYLLNWNLRITKKRKRENLSANAVANEQKATKVLGVVFFTFVLCWSPFFILNIVFAVCPECEVPNHVVDICLWLGYVSSTINPIIYTIFNRTFRAAFIRLLRCNCQRSNRPYRYRAGLGNKGAASLCARSALPLAISLQGGSLFSANDAATTTITTAASAVNSNTTTQNTSSQTIETMHKDPLNMNYHISTVTDSEC